MSFAALIAQEHRYSREKKKAPFVSPLGILPLPEKILTGVAMASEKFDEQAVKPILQSQSPEDLAKQMNNALWQLFWLGFSLYGKFEKWLSEGAEGMEKLPEMFAEVMTEFLEKEAPGTFQEDEIQLLRFLVEWEEVFLRAFARKLEKGFQKKEWNRPEWNDFLFYLVQIEIVLATCVVRTFQNWKPASLEVFRNFLYWGKQYAVRAYMSARDLGLLRVGAQMA